LGVTLTLTKTPCDGERCGEAAGTAEDDQHIGLEDDNDRAAGFEDLLCR
jgi:hypothetical protein